jgi:ethanolamine ammonia-lyase small subunit
MSEAGWPALRCATPARIGLGRTGTALPTAAQLDFQLAHARARDAVHAALDAERVALELRASGLEALHLRSQATDRAIYLRRPDLGRKLSAESRQRLLHRDEKKASIAFVVADGLSATAVNAHAVPLVSEVLFRLAGCKAGCKIAPVAVVEHGRVAIGDEIGGLLDADLVAVLIGERPGLSAADSLGVYLTWAPAPGTVDAARNCLSNIRPAGMPIPEAADALIRLMTAARRHRMTGVALTQAMGQLQLDNQKS